MKRSNMINPAAANNLIEANFRNLCARFAAVSGGEFYTSPYYNWIKNPYNKWYSRVLDINIPENKFTEIVSKLRNDIAIGTMPDYLIVGPSSNPKRINDLLPGYGFSVFYQQTGMAIALSGYDNEKQSGYEISMVNNERDLSAWLETANRAFNKERDIKLFQLLLHDSDIKFFYIRSNNIVAATIMLFIQENVAGIHFVGTLDEFRGKGFGSALTRHALSEAKKTGCETAVLQASGMGKSIYEKIGFTCYGQIYHWEYKPKLDYKIPTTCSV